MKKKKIGHCVQHCVQCGEKLEPLDNLDSGEHINPKICIQNLREKIVRMSETFLSGCLVLNSDPTCKKGKLLKNIRVVLDPPRTHNGVENPDPEDYLDFEVNFTSEFQYKFFYDLVKDRIVMIDRWEDGEDVEEKQ